MFALFTFWFAARSTMDITDYLNLIFAAGICPGWVVRPEKGDDFTTQGYGYMPRPRIVAYYQFCKGKECF